MASALWAQFDRDIGDATSAIIAAQVSPWAHLQSGGALAVDRGDGTTIRFPAGKRYAGEPQQVFWNGYIEPFLERMVDAQLRAASAAAKAHDLDAAEIVGEVAELLAAAVRKVFDRMADIDRRLLGDGHADASLRTPRRELRGMEQYIDKHAKNVIALAAVTNQKPPPMREYAWRNRVLFALLALFVIALVVFAAMP